jgi:hypothetical protein
MKHIRLLTYIFLNGKAAFIYTQFISKFYRHPHENDCAYRLACLQVIADEGSPYFDYQQTRMFFEKFIESYPNSHYINACKNWLSVINKIAPAALQPKSIAVRESGEEQGFDQVEINQLKRQLTDLPAENLKLKSTLIGLQKAIER